MKMKKRYSITFYKLYKKYNKMSFLLLFYVHYWYNHNNEFMKKYWLGKRKDQFKRIIYGPTVRQLKQKKVDENVLLLL